MKKMQKIGALLFIAVLIGVVVFSHFKNTSEVLPIACTKEAKICPDGSVIGRTGPQCEFAVCPEMPEVPDDIQEHIDSKAELIIISSPSPLSTVESPLTISGQARGYWFFEATFPVMLTDWDGKIIASHYAEATTEWMTEDFVPYTAELNFESPYSDGDPEFMRRGTLILHNSNASGLPEHDDALEIPVLFQ